MASVDSVDGDSPPRKKKQLAIPLFLGDPVHSENSSIVPEQLIALGGPNWLGTSLLDFLIHKAIPKQINESTLIASSEANALLN
jgi:hypothetical protein